MDILRLFYDCDEFCREFLPRLQTSQIAEGEKHHWSQLKDCPTLIDRFAGCLDDAGVGV